MSRWMGLRVDLPDVATLTAPCGGSHHEPKAVWPKEAGKRWATGLCEACGALIPVLKDGTLRMHRAPGERLWADVAL